MRDPEFDPPASRTAVARSSDRALAWLGARERGILVAAVAFQALVLSAIVARNARPLVGGQTVLLHVMPVDPRDLMRGDYVTLSYDINLVPPGGVRGPSGPMTADESLGRTVYVALLPEPDGLHYRGGAVTTEPPASGRFIRGTVTRYGRITFGIESYFVQEGKGRDYEKAVTQRRLSAEVAIAGNGQAALRRLVFD